MERNANGKMALNWIRNFFISLIPRRTLRQGPRP